MATRRRAHLHGRVIVVAGPGGEQGSDLTLAHAHGTDLEVSREQRAARDRRAGLLSAARRSTPPSRSRAPPHCSAAVIGVFTVVRGQSFAGHALSDSQCDRRLAAFLAGISPVWGLRRDLGGRRRRNGSDRHRPPTRARHRHGDRASWWASGLRRCSSSGTRAQRRGQRDHEVPCSGSIWTSAPARADRDRSLAPARSRSCGSSTARCC